MPIPVRSPDTDADAERVQVELLRAAPVARRLHLALSVTATVVGAARLALERTYPEDSARARDLRFVELHYGPQLAADLRDDLERRDRTRQAES